LTTSGRGLRPEGTLGPAFERHGPRSATLGVDQRVRIAPDRAKRMRAGQLRQAPPEPARSQSRPGHCAVVDGLRTRLKARAGSRRRPSAASRPGQSVGPSLAASRCAALSPVARCEPALVLKLWAVTPVDSRARSALLHSPEGEASLSSLSRFERTIGLRPIERQFAFEGERGARQDRYLQKYGLAGSVYLAAANVVRFYAACVCSVAMGCWIFAPSVALVPTVILAGFLIFTLYRVYTASRAGRAWRRKQESESQAR
jgi:hypothetical protein